MSKTWGEIRETPYDTIAAPIVAWCEEHGYSDIVVTIWINDHEQTELLEFDIDSPGLLVWRSDWWEGEKDVRLLGFAPLSDIHIHTVEEGVVADLLLSKESDAVVLRELAHRLGERLMSAGLVDVITTDDPLRQLRHVMGRVRVLRKEKKG